MSLWRFLLSLPERRRALAAAEAACRARCPAEPILGSVVCANEDSRYVVRVFAGRRDVDPLYYRMPPWRHCFVFGVDKQSGAADVEEDPKYWPRLL